MGERILDSKCLTLDMVREIYESNLRLHQQIEPKNQQRQYVVLRAIAHTIFSIQEKKKIGLFGMIGNKMQKIIERVEFESVPFSFLNEEDICEAVHNYLLYRSGESYNMQRLMEDLYAGLMSMGPSRDEYYKEAEKNRLPIVSLFYRNPIPEGEYD